MKRKNSNDNQPLKSNKKRCLEDNIIDLCKKNTDILFFAIRNNDKDLVKLFLEKNIVNVNTIQKNDESPFFYACKMDKLEIAKMLLDYGADINDGEKDPMGSYPVNNKMFRVWKYTPLICATWANKLDTVKFLLENGCLIQSKAFKTALDTSAEMTQLYLDYKADPNMLICERYFGSNGGEYKSHDQYYSPILYVDTKEDSKEDIQKKREILILLALYGGNLVYYEGKGHKRNSKISPSSSIMRDVEYIKTNKQIWLNRRTHFCQENILKHLPDKLKKDVIQYIPKPSNLDIIRGILYII